MRLSGFSSATVLLAVSVLGGCGPEQIKHPDVAPAAGIVTYNGAPVEGAMVSFFSEESKKAGWNLSGRTDAAGKFEVTSSFAPGTEMKGIPAGNYTAVVIKSEAAAMKAVDIKSDPKAYEELMKSRQRAPTEGAPTESPSAKNLIPTKYATEATSGLTVQIDKSGNSNIELKLVD